MSRTLTSAEPELLWENCLCMSSSEPSDETVTLIDALLAEQRALTAVEKFSRAHEQHELPAQARHYRDLLPTSKPQVGQQYAFEVDLDQCSGCKACVTACHSLNGLDDEETWRNVGLLHGGTFQEPVQRTVTTACHHCVEPGCLDGCPVLAYEKDAVTGIVKHLDDQCIGCQYCVLKCPYDVPKYSERLGIVRKCDLCSSRLASGEAPACVQACPNEAIRITVVGQAETVAQFRGVSGSNTFLPGSPAPDYTFPTTRYVSAKPLPGSLHPADAHELKPQPAHTPLGVMLVLSQLSVGVFASERVLSLTANQLLPALRPWLTVVALFFGLAALGASTTHLGRPLGAWRAFLGLRKSWLSREIVVFGQFAGLAILYATAVWFPNLLPAAPVAALGWATVGSGLLGVFCSAMIYHDTHRDFWHLRWSGAKFLGTTFLLGAATTLLIAACIGGEAATLIPVLSAITALAGALKLATELPIFRHLETEDWSPLHKTALLLHGPFGLLHRWRVGLGVAGGMVLPLWLALDRSTDFPTAGLMAALIFATTLAGEWIERRLFFNAVQPVKMPGGVSA